MNHQIKIEDLIEWRNEKRLVRFASSTIENKELFVCLSGNYEVHFEGKVVLRTMQPYDAVEKYNSL